MYILGFFKSLQIILGTCLGYPERILLVVIKKHTFNIHNFIIVVIYSLQTF